MLGWNQVVEVSRAEARQTFLELLDEIGFAATSWQEGSVPLAFVEVIADFWSRSTRIAVSLKSFSLNETSTGEALRRFSWSHYANRRLDAVASRRTITLQCLPTEGPHTIGVGDVILADAEGKEWRNIPDPLEAHPPAYPAVIPSGGQLTIIVEADVPVAHNPEPGAVSTMVSTYAGVTVAEDIRLRDGVDVESNERLRQRNSLKWALLTRFGLIDEAVVDLALNASAAVHRVWVQSTNPRGSGTFNVWVTGLEEGVGLGDLQAVRNAIEPYLMGEIVGAGTSDPHHVTGENIRVMEVANSDEVELHITGKVYLSAKYDWADIEPLLLGDEGHLEMWRRTIPLGGFPYPNPGNRVPINEIEHQIRNFEIGDERPIRTVVLSVPNGDVVVPHFAHVTKGTWSLTVELVSD